MILDYLQESHDVRRLLASSSKRPNPQTFWNEEEGFMRETIVTDVVTGGRSDKGSAPITVTVLNFDPTLGCDSATFQPCSDRALSNLKVVGDAFAGVFSFTQRHPPDQPGVFFGFYIDEQLLGGHVRPRRPLIYGVHQLNYISAGTIFWDFTCR
jgi:hypothetical protein